MPTASTDRPAAPVAATAPARAVPASLDAVLAAVRPADAGAVEAARARVAQLTTPPGALAALADLACRLAGATGQCPPAVPAPVGLAVFAGDHGVHAQGVSPWPQEVTAQMVANLAAGGAVASVLARGLDAQVRVVDVGVATDLPVADGVLQRRVRPGTDDLTRGPAMSRDDAVAALEVGVETARALVEDGARLLVAGDMGIANTTASAALVAALTGASPEAVTGRGTGVDDATLQHKRAVVAAALAVNEPDRTDALGVLAALGGLEHAAVAGFLLAGAAAGVPVVLDGLIAASAALVAAGLAPGAVDSWVAGHRSAEPGAGVALEALGLRPVLDLDMRLGEGSGALLAVPVVQAAARVLAETATFADAGVSGSTA